MQFTFSVILSTSSHKRSSCVHIINEVSDQLFITLFAQHTYTVYLAAMSLRNLLTPYDVRKCILGSLSAFDVAKLDIAIGNVLDVSERYRYLNPARDLIWNIREMENLSECGMKLLIIGNDTSALTNRLQDPQGYLRKYGGRRKLQVYLIGHFPTLGVTSDVVDRMLQYTITGVPSKCRSFRDKIQLRQMRTDATFIMSFGISTQIDTSIRACWHKIDDIPDCTVDLRVYIPDLYSRLREEVRLPWRESMRLSRCVLRRGWYISSLIDSFRICRDTYTLDLAYIMPRYVQVIETEQEREISIRSFRTTIGIDT
jgi:hypothetical protein